VIPTATFTKRLYAAIARASREGNDDVRAWAVAAAHDDLITEAAALATAILTRHIEAFKIDRRLRDAVVERAADRCPFDALFAQSEVPWHALPSSEVLLALALRYDDTTWAWPVNLALRDVATLLESVRDPQARRLARAFADGSLVSLQGGDVGTAAAAIASDLAASDESLREAMAQWDLRLCVLVASADLDVQEAQKRPAIVLDAGSVHHELLTGWRDLPKDRKLRKTPVQNGWAEIIYPGKQLGLRLHVQDLPERIVHAVREWKHWQGLRHWAALQLLFTDAGRTGRIRWTLDAHLDALGYGERSRRDAKVRALVAAEVDALTRMEIAIYHPDGTVRLRGPVLAVTQRGEMMSGSEWRLEGLELVIHPVLYEGVRKSSGEIGRLWAPAPVELARIDHIRHPYALALGLILPIRWRWDLTGDTDHITLTGAKLLEAAGIKLTSAHPQRAWEALQQNMEELQNVGGLGRFEWEDDGRWSLAGRCQLYQPQWVRDRMVHGLIPPEPSPVQTPLTGAELRAWRMARNWTQQEAATHLKISRRTIIRAETESDEPLPPSVRTALQDL
jgi:DNA-binding XRE family transcriptional regulator